MTTVEYHDYPEGYVSGFLNVLPIGDDGDMYIVPGHDPLAGFKIACYLNDEEQCVLGDGSHVHDFTARHIWVTEEIRVVPEDVGEDEPWEEELTFYTFWDEPGMLGAEPYTAIGDWANYRAGAVPS